MVWFRSFLNLTLCPEQELGTSQLDLELQRQELELGAQQLVLREGERGWGPLGVSGLGAGCSPFLSLMVGRAFYSVVCRGGAFLGEVQPAHQSTWKRQGSGGTSKRHMW